MIERNCEYCGEKYFTDINNYKYACPKCIKEHKSNKE